MRGLLLVSLLGIANGVAAMEDAPPKGIHQVLLGKEKFTVVSYSEAPVQ